MPKHLAFTQEPPQRTPAVLLRGFFTMCLRCGEHLAQVELNKAHDLQRFCPTCRRPQ